MLEMLLDRSSVARRRERRHRERPWSRQALYDGLAFFHSSIFLLLPSLLLHTLA